jgi:PPOX class probable F420-dependent enzyme
MSSIPDSHVDLASAPGVATLSTVGADGTPQVTAVWYLLDGDVVRFSFVTARQKYKNMAAHPKATMFILDPANPYRSLEIRGETSIADDPELAFLERLIRHYGQDPDRFPGPRDGRVIVTLTPTRVVATG